VTTFVEELLARLALDTDEQSFKKGEKGMDDLAASAVKMGAVIGASIAAVQGALTAMVVNFANEADETNKFARRVGATTESIQELDYVAERAGLSVGEMRGAISKLQKNTSEAVNGNKTAADSFAELGLRAEDLIALDPGAKMELISDAIGKIPREADRARIAMDVFGRSAGEKMLNAFEGGSEELAKMRARARDLGIFSQEDAAKAEVFNDLLLDVGKAMKGIRNIVASSLLPTLSDLIDGFIKFFIENRQLISSGMEKFFKAAAVALKGLSYAAGLFVAFKLGIAVIAAAKGVMILTAAFKAARIGALLMNAAVLVIPILIGLAVAALALLAEDFYQFFNGGESMIGDMAAKWPLLGEAIHGVADALKFAWGYAGDMFDLLKAIVTLDFSGMGDAFGRVIDRWRSMLGGFVEWVTSVLPEPLKGVLGFGGGGTTVGGESAASGVPGLPGDVSMLGAPALPSVPLMMPMQAAQVASAGNNTTKQEDNRVFNITGTDIGEVKRVLNEKNAYAAKTIDTGVQY
jgi:hypothetical protein